MSLKDSENINALPPHPVVVVGREFGSGGRIIGRKIAEAVGCAYYDKELLSHTAKSMGFDPSIFAVADERRPSPLRTLLQGLYGVPDHFNTRGLGGEEIYTRQSDVIRRLAANGPCVIVGRTADYVCRDFPGLLSVFLHAPLQYRIDAVIARGDATDRQSAAELARKYDRERQNYYNYYTGRNWGWASNYHLTIDASKTNADALAKLIADLAKQIGD